MGFTDKEIRAARLSVKIARDAGQQPRPWIANLAMQPLSTERNEDERV